MKKDFSIKEISSITGKSNTTIYRLIKSGKLPSFVVKEDGIHYAFHVKREDLEGFLGYKLKDMKSNEIHDEIHMKSSEFHLTEETLQEAIVKSFSHLSTSLMKPIEEQALYRLGILENEVKHLQSEKETLRQENEVLREQVKSLPDKTYIEKIQVESQEKEKDLIIQIEMERKEKEDLKTMTETIRHELEEKHRLELEKVKTQAGREKQEALTILQSQILDIQKEKEALQIQKEKEKKEAEEREKQIAEAWKKELELAKKPWWKFW